MKYSRNRAALAVVVTLVLILALLPLASLISLVYAAVPWTKIPGVSMGGELFVMDAYVIKDGTTYEMWYTHGKTGLSLTEIANSLSSILTDAIVTDLANLDLDALLDDLSVIDANALYTLLTDTATVIGYATSVDGIDWDVAVGNSSVLAGSNGGAFDSVGAPSVIKTDPSSYEMWYTHTTTNLTPAALAAILTGLGGDATARKAAILALLDATTTMIGHTTSTDGINWAPPDLGVLAGSGGGVFDSVGSPCVVKADSSYEMWYTQSKTDVAEGDLDTILANIASSSFGVAELMNILDVTSSTIGYATSDDGIIWTVVNSEVLAGSGGGVWDSVSAPSVLKAGSSYEMWFTQATTDLIEADIQALIDAIQALEPDISTVWDSIRDGDLTQFLIDFTDLIDNKMAAIKAILANTSGVIGYATSGDGTTWAVQNPTAMVGSSGGPWSSVGNPCVVYNSGVYEMWFTKGIDTLTAGNLVDVLQGTILPMGYAAGFNLVAETSNSPDKDTDDIVVVMVNIDRSKDSWDDSTQAIPGGISAYTAVATRDPAGIEFLDVRGVSPFDSPTFNSGTGIFSAPSSSPQQPFNSTVAKIVLRLIGDALTPYDLTVAFQAIGAAGYPGMNVLEENSNTLTFLRGDTTKNGVVDIFDALFIAQYIVGLRQLDTINAVNAASVKHDGGSGDKIDIFDALFIAQYIVGIRDANFDLVP